MGDTTDATRTGSDSSTGNATGRSAGDDDAARSGGGQGDGRTGTPDSDGDNANWKARSRQWEDAAKRLEAKLSKIEDSQKSELQRAIERAEAAEKARTDAELRSLRMDVAAKAGLPPAMANRLRGNTEAELTDDANELLKLLPANGAGSGGDTTGGNSDRGRSRPDPDQGKGDGSNAQGSSDDMNTWMRNATGRRNIG